MISNTLIDNSTEKLTMTNKLKQCLAIDGVTTISIATGYWDVPGLSLIQDELRTFLNKDGTRLRILIGKDPYVYANQVANPKVKNAKYPDDYIKTDINELEVIDDYKQSIQLLLDYCTEDDDSKIQIRIYRKDENDETKFLHSKCYIFDGKDDGIGIGIVGSSNFTQKGLEGNAELNYLECSPNSVTAEDIAGNNKTHVYWFNEKWKDAEPWNKTFLEQVLKTAHITQVVEQEKKKEKDQPFTPYELYIKLLQIKFGDIVDLDLGKQIESYLPSTMSTLSYQIEAVKRCLSIMHEHGGFMLSDVVGLGKTIVGALVIKRFLSVTDEDGREQRVLIVTPPAIQSAWKRTIADFDKEQTNKMDPCIDYITTGSIGNLIDGVDDYTSDEEGATGEFATELEQRNYGLIIIDESHRFRNSNTLMYKAIDDLISQITLNTGVSPYIGLLSATPQNNRPDDLKNQIYLFERKHKDSTLKKAEGGNIESFFSKVCQEYNQLITGNPLESASDKIAREQQLKDLSSRIRECVLDDILERRTRTDVMKYYKDDIEKQHLVFPTIKGPCVLKYIMDDELAQLFSDTMSIIAPTTSEEKERGLRYYRYRAIQYLTREDNSGKYAGRGSRDSSKVADQLARIMQIMLVKRLESSFTAFNSSLLNLLGYTENMIKMWENDTIFVCPQIDINNELDTSAKSIKRERTVTFDECVEDIRSAIKRLDADGKNEKQQNAEYSRKDFDPHYIDLLKKDYAIIQSLCVRWARNSHDPKFDAFKEALTPVIFDSEKNTAGKLVIFSEAIDTVNALRRAVENKGFKVLVITAANRHDREQTIRENFDANYEGEWMNDYQVIITTDVLAEGVNLHRANVILNYDTPWNSTRLMQRIGRVNRIGSKEPAVYVYNFMPSAQGDAQIQLVHKAHTKLQSFHTLFGEDSKIFSDNETISQYALNDAVNGEESPMEKYVFELKQFKVANPERYALIEGCNEGWEIASQSHGMAYFLVKAQRSAALAIKIDTNSDAVPHIISATEMIEALRVDPLATSVPLPDGWTTLCQKATLAYNQYFVRINTSRKQDKIIVALRVISDLYDKPNISSDSKDLLVKASQLVRKGYVDLIRKMIAVGNYLNNEQPSLFELGQDAIDQLLRREIGRIVARIEQKQGKAQILLATTI